MVSRQEDSINFSKFEKELEAAVELDNRYWRENDAKFRAVAQKVATYEEFRYDIRTVAVKDYGTACEPLPITNNRKAQRTIPDMQNTATGIYHSSQRNVHLQGLDR